MTATASPPLTLTDEYDPTHLENVAARASRALSEFVDRQAAVLAAISPALAPATAALREAILGGGKRLRPTFCYWGWRAAGGPADAAEIVTAAAGLELLHAGALIHDDIMDRSDTRRGRPSIHRLFEGEHTTAGYRGSAATFGLGAGILLGDWSMAWCDEMVDRCGLPEHRLRPARRLLQQVHTELMAGQFLDLVEQARGGGSVERARTVIRYKTAKYSVERPMQLGAILAGAGPDVLAACSAFALPLGEAFQLRDDLLGVFGDPAATGKSAGDDLREGKATVLIAFARQAATAAQLATLDRLLGDPDIDDAGLAALRSVILATGAVTAVEDLIDSHVDTALRRLAEAPFPERARWTLGQLTVAATTRAA
ncbi:MAG TPA: polyprenyl synthetase family protein [Mycobacteriales bacterium]|nr:polyprenyl synthetase family protein [Mycobacteriales bacterium]